MREVEWKLVQMPLPKLQRFGGRAQEFIYSISWADDVKKGEFNGAGFNNIIEFEPGAAEMLVRLSPLLRPLIYREWAAMVARINGLENHDLESFLFDFADDFDASAIRGPLLELQSGRCFYCDAKINADAQVDHFIARARHPDHGLENLVVAHPQCNGSKSDNLAHTDHLRAWAERIDEFRGDLAMIAAQTRWQRDPGRTINIVRTIYEQVASDALLWRRASRTKSQWRPIDLRDRQDAFMRMRAAEAVVVARR